MHQHIFDIFEERWKKYFAGSELPIAFYYTDKITPSDLEKSDNEYRCLIGNLNRVREGFPFIYEIQTPGCPGGKRYSGYTTKLRSNFNYFLSCGIPGQVKGERYKKSPEIVEQFMTHYPSRKAPGKYLVFKRIDKLNNDEKPLAIIFFANNDVLSALFTLANFDYDSLFGVIAPMGSGCASIIYHALLESDRDKPRCILGMFDISARPEVPKDRLTFTIPMRRFEEMTLIMDQSFLITEQWQLVKERL
jgi:hypothetical protein